MSRILEHFIELTKIPHCSGDTSQLRDFLVAFATERDYTVEVDSYDNIFIHKGRAKIALQAHYDMVCVGRAPTIETFEEDGWLKAKDSSLGADNGIAIAMMIELMERGVACEFLLTNDEEIGLIGAKALNFKLQSNYMLNLDSEDEAEVYIGCAGGEDIIVSQSYENYAVIDENIYEVSLTDLPGGHSGVDIDKGIPSAIKGLVAYLQTLNCQLVTFEAGERRNSIPANAKAIIATTSKLPNDAQIKRKALSGSYRYYENTLLELLEQLPHGVLAYNEELKIPNSSVNLALVDFQAGRLSLTLSIRGMSEEALVLGSNRSIDTLKHYNMQYHLEDNYPAWQPQMSAFTKLVDTKMAQHFGSSKFMAIHAGLECGVIGAKYPDMAFASIGPTIRYPHSKSESLKIDSVEKIFGVVIDVIDALQGDS